MGTETNKDDRNSPEYLQQLLKDKKQIQAFPNVFVHLERLLDDEINRVRITLFHNKGSDRPLLSLPDPVGPTITLSEKVFVPVKEFPDFNFVGRILGPRGMTAKDLEHYTGCKVMVRGKGSMRDKKKEELNRDKPNWGHLNEELHVLITVEDTRNRAEVKLQKALEEIKKLLVPAAEGEDNLKKQQLMELAILNGTYRDGKVQPMLQPAAFHAFQSPRMIPAHAMTIPQMRSPTPAGHPIILTPRIPTATPQHGGILSGGPPPLVSPSEAAAGLIYTNPFEYPYAAFTSPAATTLLEYPTLDQAAAGGVPKLRRSLAGVREHPYTRLATNILPNTQISPVTSAGQWEQKPWV